MKLKFYRLLAPILCVFLILASLPFVSAESFSETPIILVVDHSEDGWQSYSTSYVELSDVVLPNGQWRSIRIREIQIPITEGNIDSIVNIDFVFSGALIAAAGETHNVGYTKTGGDFSNYYTSASYGSKRYVRNFSDSRIFFDYVFPQNISTIRQFYFTPLAYHVIASVKIDPVVGQTFTLTCSNPPTFTFWENQTSNIIPSYWVFRGFSSVLADYDALFGTVMQSIEFFRDSYVDMTDLIINKLNTFDFDFISTQIQRNADLTAELVEIESQHQDLSNQFLEAGGQTAIDDGAQALNDSNAFAVVDDVFTGFSFGPEFDSTQFESVWGNDSAIGWFSQRTQQNIHSPNTRNPLDGHEIIDFISNDIEEVYNAIEGETNDQSAD